MNRRGHDKGWRDFVAWCRARRLRPLPAHPWTVAAYARWCETRHRFPVLLQRIRAIARAHLLHALATPDRHPTVLLTLRGIEVRDRHRGRSTRLFPEEQAQHASAAPDGETARPRRGRVRSLRSTPRLVARRSRPGP
jgi:hypothetical protein